MDKKLRNKWVRALRSGDYKQTRGKLKNRSGAMCCLGVLCDIQGKKWVWGGKRYEDALSIMPLEVIASGVGATARILAHMNDGAFGHHKHSLQYGPSSSSVYQANACVIPSGSKGQSHRNQRFPIQPTWQQVQILQFR